MKQEDRQLLLKDLCARMPYGLKGTVGIEVSTGEYSIESGHLLFMEKEIDVELLEINKDTEEIEVHSLDNNIDLSEYDYTIDDFKPYLRPLSSMTEEEAKEISILYGLKDILSIKIKDEYIEVVVDDGVCSTEIRTIWYDEIMSSIEIFDFLNAHHFDYRGLIPKDLAIEVTKENNPYKE